MKPMNEMFDVRCAMFESSRECPPWLISVSLDLPSMTHLLRNLIILSVLVTSSNLLSGQESEQGTKNTIESPSPDGQFAFRYAGDAESEKQTYDLIDKGSGKVLTSVAESDPDLGPSARFHINKVL